MGENDIGGVTCCSTPRSPLAWKGSITQGVPAASPTPIMSSLAVLNAPNAAMAHSASFDEAYPSHSNTVKVNFKINFSSTKTFLTFRFDTLFSLICNRAGWQNLQNTGLAICFGCPVLSRIALKYRKNSTFFEK